MLSTAAVLSVPVVYNALDKWLGNFANRMDISPVIFVIPVLTVSAFSLIMVVGQSAKIARKNPAETLSCE